MMFFFFLELTDLRHKEYVQYDMVGPTRAATCRTLLEDYHVVYYIVFLAH